MTFVQQSFHVISYRIRWVIPDHVLGFGKGCPHPRQPSLSRAGVWLLLVVLAMDALRSLLKPNMVLNQISKCLGVLWKTHIQAALAKPGSVCVHVWVRASQRGRVKAYRAEGRQSHVCVNREGEMCVLFVRALSCLFFVPAPVPPVRQRFNKQHNPCKGSRCAHTQAVSSRCAMHMLWAGSLNILNDSQETQ